MAMLKVWGDRRSGNCLKIAGLLDRLGQAYVWIDVDVMAGETRTPVFLARNPAGQIPFVEFSDGRGLAQSNAILLHFAEGTPFLPSDAHARALVFEWMFWEQYSHEPAIAVRRFQKLYLGKSEDEIDPRLLDKGNAALDRMEQRLKDSDWLVGDTPTVADVALLPYTALAHQGGFDLSRTPAVEAWVRRTLQVFPMDV